MKFKFPEKKGPLLDEDGKILSVTVRIEGKHYRCLCGCNVFHHPDKNDKNLYKCNACGQQFEGT